MISIARKSEKHLYFIHLQSTRAQYCGASLRPHQHFTMHCSPAIKKLANRSTKSYMEPLLANGRIVETCTETKIGNYRLPVVLISLNVNSTKQIQSEQKTFDLVTCNVCVDPLAPSILTSGSPLVARWSFTQKTNCGSSGSRLWICSAVSRHSVLTWSGSPSWPQWADRPGSATRQRGCGRAPAAGRRGGRPCCTHRTG